jgi:Flp pilus assembly protein TadD
MRFLRHISYFLILVTLLIFSSSCTKDNTPFVNQKEAISSVLWQLATAAEIDRNYEKAASHYDRLYAQRPNDKKVIIGYTRNLRYLGLSNESIKILKTKLIQFPDDTDLQMELGKSQLAASLINDASDTLVKIIERTPESWEAHSALGIILDRGGNFENAQTSFNRALKLSPNNMDVMNNLALSLAQAGQLNQAIKMLEKIIQDKSAGPQSRQNLAMFYGLKGKFEKARRLSQTDLPKNLVNRNLLIFQELLTAPPSVDSADAKHSNALHQKQNLNPTNKSEEMPIYITIGSATIRNGPSGTHEVVKILSKGQEVRLSQHLSTERWSFVILKDRQYGFVLNTLIRRK